MERAFWFIKHWRTVCSTGIAYLLADWMTVSAVLVAVNKDKCSDCCFVDTEFQLVRLYDLYCAGKRNQISVTLF